MENVSSPFTVDCDGVAIEITGEEDQEDKNDKNKSNNKPGENEEGGGEGSGGGGDDDDNDDSLEEAESKQEEKDDEDEIMFHEMMDENDFTDRQNIKETYYSDLADDYNDYYEEVYDSAMGGDQACIDEIREEFGDDWESEAIQRVRAIIEKVAPTEARVMITGDNGTGKEVVAREQKASSAGS